MKNTKSKAGKSYTISEQDNILPNGEGVLEAAFIPNEENRPIFMESGKRNAKNIKLMFPVSTNLDISVKRHFKRYDFPTSGMLIVYGTLKRKAK